MALRICFVSSEIAPLAKTGGLADVAGALGRYLHREGHDVRLFMPLYSGLGVGKQALTRVPEVQNISIRMGSHPAEFSLYLTTLPGTPAPVYLVDCPQYFDRAALYSSAPDEHLRFLLLQQATMQSCQRLRFAPDIMHCNDWHAALLPLMIRNQFAWDALFSGTRTLLTIHNIGYQGVFSAATASDLGFDAGLLNTQELSLGRINWLRQGIEYADAVTTVSPTYAHEICTPSGGYGLDDSLRARANPVRGILNGVDDHEWNPRTDPLLPHHYSPDDLAGKALLKLELLAQLGLQGGPDLPLAGIISRLTVQKGFELLFEALPDILAARPLRLAALGTGEPRYEDFFARLSQRFPGRVSFRRGYDEGLAHLIEAGSDMFLMPSLYEPCGLNQMYSLKYGTVPIVRRTGGLADSVQMWSAHTGTGTGIVFNDFDAPAMRWALDTALDLYADPTAWRRIMQNGMAQDFSWNKQGKEYVRLYEELVNS